MSDSVIPWTVACHAPLSTGILQARTLEWEDDGGVGGHGVHLSPWIHQEYTFRHRSTCRTPAESRQEYLTREKEYIEPRKLRRRKELGGKTGVLVAAAAAGLDLPSLGGGTEAGVRSPHQDNCLS